MIFDENASFTCKLRRHLLASMALTTPFNIAANLTLNTMASSVILLVVRTARIACSDRHTDIHTHETTTVSLSTHAPRGLIN